VPKRTRTLLKGAKRLFSRAEKAAIHLAKGKKPKIAVGCAAALKTTIDQVEIEFKM
jgi:hypothetical protein